MNSQQLSFKLETILQKPGKIVGYSFLSCIRLNEKLASKRGKN